MNLKKYLSHVITAAVSIIISLILFSLLNYGNSNNNLKVEIIKLKKLLNEKEKKLKILMSQRNQLTENELKLINYKIKELDKKIEKKIELKKSNLLFSKKLQYFIKKTYINSKRISKLRNQIENKLKELNKIIIENINNIQKNNIKITNNKEKLKNVRIPDMIRIKKEEIIGNNVLLYLGKNRYIKKDSVIGDLKILDIDPKNKLITVKVINKKAKNYNKEYKIPYEIKIF